MQRGLESGFQKAGSTNMPKVDGVMVAEFFAFNPNFFGPEMRNVKSTRAAGEEYGDSAVGWVQVKKDANMCFIKGKMTPEHKVRSSPYLVEAVIDSTEEKVISVICKGCAASQGGCKHAIAFLLWVHRRSAEPSPTSVQCYWKKCTLSDVEKCNLTMKALYKKDPTPRDHRQRQPTYVQQLVEKLPQEVLGGLFDIVKGPPVQMALSMWQLCMDYKEVLEESGQMANCDDFLQYLVSKMTPALCTEVEMHTRGQSKDSLWYEIRFGRITASKVWETSRFKKLDGSLTEAIMGACTVPDTPAIIRGKTLEPLVIAEVEKIRKMKIKKCGVYLHQDFPLFGASPDGICDLYCIEVKCPAKEKTVKNYLHQGKIATKYSTQLQLQMLFAERNKGLFCVAAPHFETTKEVEIIEVELENEKILQVVKKAEEFWKKAIFPRIFQAM